MSRTQPKKEQTENPDFQYLHQYINMTHGIHLSNSNCAPTHAFLCFLINILFIFVIVEF